MKNIPPKLVSDDGKACVIRPLAYVAEDTARWAAHRNFPSSRYSLLGSQEPAAQAGGRDAARVGKRFPGGEHVQRPRTGASHLLDGSLYDFKNARATGVGRRKRRQGV